MSLIELSVLLAGYTLIGATAKIADDAFDEKLYPYWLGVTDAALCTLLFSYFVLTDYWSRPVFIGITIGVLLAHKVDNLVFVGIVVLGGVLPLIVVAILGHWGLDCFALAWVTFWGWLDEVGNDWVDQHHRLGRASFFLEYRFGLKLGIFLLCLFYTLPWLYLLAFLIFDAGYGLLAFGAGVGSQKSNKGGNSCYTYRQNTLWFLLLPRAVQR